MKIPDFLIALPTVILSILCLLFYSKSYEFLPLYFHFVAILLICLTTANVQIITRMVISSCPLYMWYVAHLYDTESKLWRVMISVYWLGYCFVGTCVFSLFLPWTYECLFLSIQFWSDAHSSYLHSFLHCIIKSKYLSSFFFKY